ncbi:sugar phosphate isomerase/epimerase [Peribacillus muralis]|uniref:sugar phosphate isomerase/epimerase family protein n=1 Tax=Peribacillus muralis TaxID=264697 RepID=UPI001F4DFDB7|nr:sugar phosphate isomerase/epimerase [Peribacillus muralis]MCK1993547.1 sugar phosphate isomerase/epimerase [Peribacillus muralis]MCK2014165.1 sugar phosphate isomerase/epimerase [Peribacillus muralis]
MNLGIRGHDIENRPIDELAKEIACKGLSSVQLILKKSLSDINTELGSLSPGFAHKIGKAFSQHDIQIAVLGCYFNLIHPDPVERRYGLERFKEHIRYARDFGCSLIATETGNVNADIIYTEENFKEEPFQEVVNSVRELVAEAEKFGTIVGIEAGVNHPIYSPKTVKRLLDLVDSNNLQVVFDPVNLLTIDNYARQDEVFQEAFELFGDRIAIFHAKDFIIEDNKLITTAVGKGLLNYDYLFSYIKRKKPFINIILEETTEPFIDDSLNYLRGKYEQA